MVVNTQPTINTTNAVILTQLVVGAAGTPSGVGSVGGETRGTQEWDLKQNTDYVFIATNQSGNTNESSLIVDWYEHTDKG
jgi:hypothetical protein